MRVKQVVALPEQLEVTTIEKSDDVLTITAVSLCSHPCCPLCGKPSTRTHSRYIRQVADLPCGGQQVRLLIHVRKCFCDVPDCPRKIFVERLTPLVDPFARVTRRLYQIVQIIGLATGGRLGMRVTDRLGIQLSRHTLLRRIMALPTAPAGQIGELGIDDFSFRRGRRFGTILVNLQTRQVIDVLADRKAETAAAWMASHPEITLVSRDCGVDYASAATTGAPQAVQCADRFHILKNLGEALEGCLARHLAAKRKTQTQKTLEEHIPIEEAPPVARRSAKVERLEQAYREERLACYEQVVALHQLGMSQARIAEQVGIGHSTVSRWLAARGPIERRPGPYVSRLDPYLPYLFERWEQGCHNMAALYRELRDRGYKGGYESVRNHLVCRLPGGKKNVSKGAKLAPVPLPPRQATFLFLR